MPFCSFTRAWCRVFGSSRVLPYKGKTVRRIYVQRAILDVAGAEKFSTFTAEMSRQTRTQYLIVLEFLQHSLDSCVSTFRTRLDAFCDSFHSPGHCRNQILLSEIMFKEPKGQQKWLSLAGPAYFLFFASNGQFGLHLPHTV
jgi:hypothetical protein